MEIILRQRGLGEFYVSERKLCIHSNSVMCWGDLINLDSILKNRDITLSTKVHLVKAMVFPVVMYGCESWTVKKAEHRRIDAFELWCWRRVLRVPWTARRSTQSILKEISPGCSLEGLMLKLKIQYFGHTSDNFISSFWTFMPFIAFFLHSAIIRTSSTMLKSKGERRYPFLVPDLSRLSHN